MMTSSAKVSVNASRESVRSFAKTKAQEWAYGGARRNTTAHQNGSQNVSTGVFSRGPSRSVCFNPPHDDIIKAESAWQNEGRWPQLCDFRLSCALSLPPRPADWRDRTDGIGSHVDVGRLPVFHQERRGRDPFEYFAYTESGNHEAEVENVRLVTGSTGMTTFGTGRVVFLS